MKIHDFGTRLLEMYNLHTTVSEKVLSAERNFPSRWGFQYMGQVCRDPLARLLAPANWRRVFRGQAASKEVSTTK
mgnify:CR=1 FL=1